MTEDIDDILANYLNHEPLTNEEKQQLEKWMDASDQNKRFGKVLLKLEQQKKVLDHHQKQDVVFANIERKIYRVSKKRRFLLCCGSCAAGIILLIGIFSTLNRDRSTKKEVVVHPMSISKLTHPKSSVELILPNGKKCLLDAEETTIILSDSTGEMRTSQKTLIVEANTIKEREPEYYTINIPLGAEYNMVLPDGSKIYLNAGSTLRYPDQFVGKHREVFLDGEAYFEVTSDSLHSFIVHAAGVKVQVLGTSFNVNAYPDETWVKTTLVEGRVETVCGDNCFIMEPGTQVAYNKETRKAETFPVNTLQYTSWKDGYYDFEDMPLGELMQIFSRWYNIKLEFAKPELRKIKFSGRLKRYDDLHSLFDMLEYTRDIQFVVENDKIVIQEK